MKLEIFNGEAIVKNEEGAIVGLPRIDGAIKNIAAVSQDLLTNEDDKVVESVRKSIVNCLYKILEKRTICDFDKENSCKEKIIKTSDILSGDIKPEDVRVITTSSNFKGIFKSDGYAFLVVDNKDNCTTVQLTRDKNVVSKWRNFNIFATEEEKKYFYEELIKVLTAKDTIRITNKFLPGMNTYQINSVDITGELDINEVYGENILDLLLNLVQS